MRSAAMELSEDRVPVRSGRSLSVTLWIIQGLLAALFILAGVMKFVMPIAQTSTQSLLSAPLFIHFIGVCEVLGGIGLVLPALLRIWPVLTPIAACGLVIIMVGATVVTRSAGWFVVVPLFMGIMAAFVAYCRVSLRPIQPRTRS